MATSADTRSARVGAGRRAALGVAALALLSGLLANAAWLDGLVRGGEAGGLSGLHTLNSEDTPTYYAWIEQARHGRLLFRQLYTTESHEPALSNPLFWLAGALAAATGLGNAGAYHALRVLLGLAVPAAAYALFAVCLPDLRRRLAALAILLFAGGLGFAFQLAGAPPAAWPIDAWVPEASLFLSLVESPLNLAAYALWALLAAAALRGLGRSGAAPLAAACAAAALLVWMRPYAGAPLAALAVLGGGAAAALGRAAPARAAVVAGAITIGVGLGIAPSLHALASGPAFAAWREASTAPAPAPLALLAGLAGPLSFAALGVRGVFRRGGAAGPWLLAWIVVVLTLVYVEVGPQVAFSRKLLEGLPLPLAAFGGEGALVALRRLAPRARLPAFALVLALLFGSSAGLLWRDARAFAAGGYPYRLPGCLRDGFAELRARAEPAQVVLAPRLYGLLVPAFAGRPVVCCHRDQTRDAARKAREVDAFYASGAAPRAALLERYGADFVLYGPGRRPAPELSGRLELAFRTSCLVAFRVRP